MWILYSFSDLRSTLWFWDPTQTLVSSLQHTARASRDLGVESSTHLGNVQFLDCLGQCCIAPPHFLSMHRLKMQHWLGVGFTELEQYVFYQPGGYPCFVSRNIRRCRREDTYKIYHHSSSPLWFQTSLQHSGIWSVACWLIKIVKVPPPPKCLMILSRTTKNQQHRKLKPTPEFVLIVFMLRIVEF